MSDLEKTDSTRIAELENALREAWPYVPDHHGPIQHKIKSALLGENKFETLNGGKSEALFCLFAILLSAFMIGVTFFGLVRVITYFLR